MVKTLVLKFSARKSTQISQKITLYVKNMKKKTVKEGKLHKFLVFAYQSQDFAKSQKDFVLSQDRETVKFS